MQSKSIKFTFFEVLGFARLAIALFLSSVLKIDYYWIGYIVIFIVTIESLSLSLIFNEERSDNTLSRVLANSYTYAGLNILLILLLFVVGLNYSTLSYGLALSEATRVCLIVYLIKKNRE